MTEHDGFTVERDGAVATITLNVPGKLNRVSMAARDQLSAAFTELDADEAVRFVVLTGADGRFTAGGDAGVPRALALAGLAAREERRRAGALLQARDRAARGTSSGSGWSSRSRATSVLPPTTSSSASPRSPSG